MAERKYYRAILDALQGQTPDLQILPRDRLDWAGPGAMLELYHRTSGVERGAIIRAIGQVIQKHPAAPGIIAQLIDVASALDLAEVEPQVRALQDDIFAAQEPLRSAIQNYLCYRQLQRMSEPPGRTAANGKVDEKPSDSASHQITARRKRSSSRKRTDY